jgi:hypothetical protein
MGIREQARLIDSEKNVAYFTLPTAPDYDPRGDEKLRKLVASKARLFVVGRPEQVKGVAPLSRFAGFTGGADPAEGLYGNTRTDHSYADRVLAWAHERGWAVHHNQDKQVCPITLRRVKHSCAHCDYDASLVSMSRSDLGWNLDHVVLLRQGPSADPLAWGLLSQPYAEPSDDDLGLAPYGFGTRALLYTVDDLPDDAGRGTSTH